MMAHEFSGGEHPGELPVLPTDTNLAIQDLAQGMIDNMRPVITGAYRKGFFNGLLFRGVRVAPDIRDAATNLLAADPRVRQRFTAGDQVCYYWSSQPGSAEEKFTDFLRDTIIPNALDLLYDRYGGKEFSVEQLGPVVSKLSNFPVASDGPRTVQPWESVKLFSKAHERVTSRLSPNTGNLLLRLAPPQSTAP